jgi:predicted dienelactone hydrolase
MRQLPLFRKIHRIQFWFSCLGTSILSCSAIAASALPATAVERITLKLGPSQTVIYVSDLETFAQTGHISKRLAPFRAFLTPTVRASLKSNLSVEPTVRDRVLHDLLNADNGQPMVQMLTEVVPDLDPNQLKTALKNAEKQPKGVTFTTVLRAIPDKNLTVHSGALLRVLSQLGISHLEQSALSQVLRQELIGNSPLPFSSEFEPSLSGHHVIEHWSVAFRDQDRDRLIPTELYWSKHRSGPTVVLSHGFGADRHFLDYMAQHLASYGLTVLALEHPGSNVNSLISDTGTLLPPEEFVERPQDVSFVLDQLEELNRRSFFLRGRFNLHDVTLIGHSLGGYTGLVLAGGKVNPAALAQFCADLEVGTSSPAEWFQCAAADAQPPKKSLADKRITQLVLLNPVGVQVFGEDGLRAVKVPTLVVTSTRDGIASVSDQQLRSFGQLSGPRSLIAIIGGTHLSVGDPDNINPALTQVPFMPEYPQTDTMPLRQYLNGTVLSFLMQQTPEADRFRPYLTPEYAQLFSTAALPIRYSDRLPTSLNQWLTNRDLLSHRLPPTLRTLASFLHLEWIGTKHRLAQWHKDAITAVPLSPAYRDRQAWRSGVGTATQSSPSLNQRSFHPAEWPQSGQHSADSHNPSPR